MSQAISLKTTTTYVLLSLLI
uniref:Uncharacterized protein n=1 Tax=Arundo donax TaxID=35708 RepID=A0A0A8YAX6_ARUDO